MGDLRILRTRSPPSQLYSQPDKQYSALITNVASAFCLQDSKSRLIWTFYHCRHKYLGYHPFFAFYKIQYLSRCFVLGNIYQEKCITKSVFPFLVAKGTQATTAIIQGNTMETHYFATAMHLLRSWRRDGGG